MHLIIAIFFLAGSFSTSRASDHVRIDMELLEITEEESSIGWTTFRGSVANKGNRTIQFPQIVITLKLDGQVVEFRNGFIEGPSGNELSPGETGFFEVILFSGGDDFNVYSVSFDGRLDAVSPEFVTGQLRVLEETLNGVEFLGSFAVLGEVMNETNVVVSNVAIRFRLYDGDGELVGFGEAEYSLPREIYPGEVVPFRAESDADFSRVSSYELIEPIQYVAERIHGASIPTTVEGTSWGAIKGAL